VLGLLERRSRASPRGTPRRAEPHRTPRRFRVRFTREGRAFLLFTVGVGLAAVNTGNNLLYLMLSLMLSLLVLNGMLSEWVMRGLEVERRLPRRLFAGTPALVELALRNHKTRLSSYSLEVEDVVAGAPADRRCYFLKVPPRGEQTSRYPRVAARRGDLAFEGFEVRTRYPFGLIERIRFVPEPATALVYPRLARSDDEGPADRRRGHGDASPRSGLGPEVAGLRDWRDGEEARGIHWRRSAGLGRLVVRERHAEADAHVDLQLDARRPADADDGWDQRFEDAIAQAAGVTDRALRGGRSVEVRVHGAGRSPRLPAGAPPDPVLRFLARLEPVAEPPGAAPTDGGPAAAPPPPGQGRAARARAAGGAR